MCDRQTDRQTDRITTPKTALAYARAVKTIAKIHTCSLCLELRFYFRWTSQFCKPNISSVQILLPRVSHINCELLCVCRCLNLNPLEPSVIVWLHFECSAPWPDLPFLISDIRALWRVPECQKLKWKVRPVAYGKVQQFEKLGFKGLRQWTDLRTVTLQDLRTTRRKQGMMTTVFENLLTL